MKKICIVLLTFSLLTFAFPTKLNALEMNSDTQSNETNKFYDVFGNYNNPETGEYFYWDNPNSKSASRTFSFKIRYTLSSSYFKLGGTNVRIDLNRVSFEHYNGYASTCCNNHHFQVNLRRDGLSNNVGHFYAPFAGAKKSLGSGFCTSSNYLVEITNIDGLPSSIY